MNRAQSIARNRKQETREGAVMLVVMLILMVVTASAAIAVRTTQSELHAAGQDRLALQTAYTAEAAIMTTTAWIDFASYQNRWLDIWKIWAALSVPSMLVYGEPPIDPNNRHYASRTTGLDAVAALRPGSGGEVPPLTMPGGATFDDPAGIGSFGPKQSYGLAQDTNAIFAYVVDVNDCFMAPSAASPPGSPVGGSGGGLTPKRFYCVLTARGRLQLPGNITTRDTTFRQWTFGSVTYNQDMTMTAHDARATILTPELLVPGP